MEIVVVTADSIFDWCLYLLLVIALSVMIVIIVRVTAIYISRACLSLSESVCREPILIPKE